MELVKTRILEFIAQPALLRKRVYASLTVSRVLVLFLMALALGMFLINIRTLGDANAYYTASVKSMLKSWHNFFFVAAEPGGAISVDKPPLGLWIEAAFGFLFGVSGFTLALPNLIVGTLSIPLLYAIVKQHMGQLAGIVAALVMVVTPVFVATHRHNTLDGMLVFTLLLAAWAVVRATETGQLRWLLLCGLFMGLGFNIKMLQALLPLPAFFALYFLGAQERWLRKAINLLLTTVLFVGVSLAWVLIVDSVPANQRPFVGSTVTNQVSELIYDYNAAKRIFDPTAPPLNTASTDPDTVDELEVPPRFNGSGITFKQQTGNSGLFRFFIPPMSRQMSWLMPFAMMSILIALFGARLRLPLSAPLHKALVLWGGWMLTCFVFFSIISGIFHPYYLMVMVPAFSATVAIGFTRLWMWGVGSRWAGVCLALAVAVTLAFQWFAIQQFNDRVYIPLAAGVVLVVGSLLLIVRRRSAFVLMLAAMLTVPAYWTGMTAISYANQTFPSAYAGGSRDITSSYVENDPNLSANQRILAYLQSNTQDVKYLVAVPSAMQGMPLVLTSERPVLYMGGFSGLDRVIDAQGLQDMVAKGELRYVLYAKYFRRPGGTGRGDTEILAWLNDSCLTVPEFKDVIVYTRRPARPDEPLLDGYYSYNPSLPRNDFLTLYLCSYS
jgi:4-amino-4-deoxy-L-arabinose transferase-like glycosyltransferase